MKNQYLQRVFGLMLVILLIFSAGWPIVAYACDGLDSPMEMAHPAEMADGDPVPVLRPPCVDMACCDAPGLSNQGSAVAPPSCTDCLSQPELGPSMALASQREGDPKARAHWGLRHAMVPRPPERSAAVVLVQWSPHARVGIPQSLQVLYASFLI